ncbi:MAG: threonine--tRNA ligase, partial [Lachnospiraceae bacterium]|nr:threonine--tRNA ligase [Lachnospiraceae bacterium]
QLDFCLPMKFILTYIDADGLKKTPVVLHRAILGSLDRFMAYILEETRGNLPLWLAPVQVKVLPVKNDDAELCAYAEEVNDLMYENHIRVEYDDRSEKLGYKMREAQIQKIPYILVLGNNEKEARTVTFRLHGKQESVTVPVDEFIKKIREDIETKKYDL